MTKLNEDEELLAALGIELAPPKLSRRTPREERIIAGFEDILRFYQTYGRAPRHGQSQDIFERLYAVRLEQIRMLPEAATLLAELDNVGLLTGVASIGKNSTEIVDDDALLQELGLDSGENDSITALKHVRSFSERNAAEEIGQRKRCHDFERFKLLMQQIHHELKAGIRTTRRFKEDAQINQGEFYIVGGQLVYVAELAALEKDEHGKLDGRMRLIYDNGTESNILLRSLQKALYKDEVGRRVTDPDAGPLFAAVEDEDDIESGTIYVLRSLSSNPYIAEHRELIHKIGVTGGQVETRIAGAKLDPTYLMADVQVIATYQLHNINRTRLEKIFHRVFGAAQLDLTIVDRFGNPIKPREWFFVPLHVIDEAVSRIRDGSITQVIYDPKLVRWVNH